jgi:hypothetical protein
MVPRGGESTCGGGDVVVELPCLEELNMVECPRLKSIPRESCFIKTCKIGDQDMWGIGPFYLENFMSQHILELSLINPCFNDG